MTLKMERCYKILIVSLLVLQNIFIQTSQIYGLEDYLENKAETNFSEEKEDVQTKMCTFYFGMCRKVSTFAQ